MASLMAMSTAWSSMGNIRTLKPAASSAAPPAPPLHWPAQRSARRTPAPAPAPPPAPGPLPHSPAPAPRVVHAPQTAIDFDDLEIEATLARPSGVYVLARRQASFNPMIRLRTDFEAELAQSVGEVR